MKISELFEEKLSIPQAKLNSFKKDLNDYFKKDDVSVMGITVKGNQIKVVFTSRKLSSKQLFKFVKDIDGKVADIAGEHELFGEGGWYSRGNTVTITDES